MWVSGGGVYVFVSGLAFGLGRFEFTNVRTSRILYDALMWRFIGFAALLRPL